MGYAHGSFDCKKKVNNAIELDFCEADFERAAAHWTFRGLGKSKSPLALLCKRSLVFNAHTYGS